MVTKSEKKALRLKQKKEEIQKQRSAAKKKRQQKKLVTGGIIAGIILIVVALGYNNYVQNKGPGEFDDFAYCLTNAGAGMYGTDWCPHCQEQKQMFGKSFKHVTYINCDANPRACQAEGVTGYPTWIFADGDRVSGTQALSTLAERTGCSVRQG